MTFDPKALADTAHLWALDKARETIRAAFIGHDPNRPALADFRAFTLPGGDGPREVRLYQPLEAADDTPLMLYFHGGGFFSGDLDTHEALCVRLADASGLRVLAASYCLAPEHPFPAQLDDALAVARAAQADRALSAGRALVMAGDSAGGYLAASVAARLNAETPGAVSAQLLIYPLVHVDEEVWAADLLRHTRALGWAAVRYIRAAIKASAESAPSLLADGAVSAIPTVIVTGGPLDPVSPDADPLADRLEAAGAPVARRTYPTMIHGFANLTHVSATAREAAAEAGRLIARYARGDYS
jgi:acetyl esterase